MRYTWAASVGEILAALSCICPSLQAAMLVPLGRHNSPQPSPHLPECPSPDELAAGPGGRECDDLLLLSLGGGNSCSCSNGFPAWDETHDDIGGISSTSVMLQLRRCNIGKRGSESRV